MTRKRFGFVVPLVLLLWLTSMSAAQPAPFGLNADALADGKPLELKGAGWQYHIGDDLRWADADFSGEGWNTVESTYLDAKNLPPNDWNGRAWFRLRVNVDESAAGRTLAMIVFLRGASEVYVDGRKIASFGRVGEQIDESNPNRLPIPFRFETPGVHTIAVRYGSTTFEDLGSGRSAWLTNGGVYPGFMMSLADAEDVYTVIEEYANGSSMRGGFLFGGVLLGLALLHFLLYIFYRVERANLFYSIYAASFGFFLIANNLIMFGHQSLLPTVYIRAISSVLLAADFVGLLAFLHVAFGRRIGKLFWALAALWAVNAVTTVVLLNNLGTFLLLANVVIGLTFSFAFYILSTALRQRRPGAWILMGGVGVLMLGMTYSLLIGFKLINPPSDFNFLSELAIVLGVPIAVSIFLARNFARTNRDLKAQLAQVELLSAQQIVQERAAAELRIENERRTRELEEARQMQLSLLPNKLPSLPDLEIAAYMRPATEVGGDYYDFHVGADGTLTVAVGDATGHGLKAGSVVTATKSLFNAFAEQDDIPQIMSQTSRALKKMNLRGLFMAMALLKIKDGAMTLSNAGMPSVLIYRASTGRVDEVSMRALPLGSIARTAYLERKIALEKDDCVVIMSDGFPEMFNVDDEILGFDKAAELLPGISHLEPAAMINELVRAGDEWSGVRPADDDVTFVVVKVS